MAVIFGGNLYKIKELYKLMFLFSFMKGRRERRKPAWMADYMTGEIDELQEIEPKPNLREKISDMMFVEAPCRRRVSSKVVRRAEIHNFSKKKFMKLFPAAQSFRKRKSSKILWKSTRSIMQHKSQNIRDLEEIFGKEFYCRPFRQNVVVLLGPVNFKLVETTMSSCKRNLVLRKNQENDEEKITDLKVTSFISMKITFRSTVVSRLKGNRRGYWKKEVASLIRHQ